MKILVCKIPDLPATPVACIYKICFGLGYYYIGSTVNLAQRIDKHLNNIKNGSRDINEYIGIISGKYTVSFTILEKVHNICDIQSIEQKYLDESIGNAKCLNVAKIASINRKVAAILANLFIS